MNKKLTLVVLSLFGLLGTVKAQGEALPVDEVLMSIPSPLEIQVLKQELSLSYNKNDLNDFQTASSYKIPFQQALNLGVYSADLGYAHIFNEKDDALNYLGSIEALADSLGVRDSIDYIKIEKYIQSENQLDELINQSSFNFEKMQKHLKSEKKGDVGILTLTGFWVEAFYLNILQKEKMGFDLFKYTLFDQSLALKRLLPLLNLYQNNISIEKKFLEDLEQLDSLCDGIKLEVKQLPYRKPESIFDVPPSEEILIIATDTQINQITAQITNIRNKIINNQYK